VIFGERALNYEEGKWESADVFAADYNLVKTPGDTLERYVAFSGQRTYKHGDFISGCAVRMDAAHILDRVKMAVSELEQSARHSLIGHRACVK
jgi:hypothetical protein